MERIELGRFAAEVGRRFEFLVGSYGMEGPESSDLLLPSVFYRRPELLVAVFLDQNRNHPRRRIEVWICPRTSCRLEGLHGPVAQHTLDNNATWLRRLMPLLLGPEALDLARERTRRSRNITWKYT